MKKYIIQPILIIGMFILCSFSENDYRVIDKKIINSKAVKVDIIKLLNREKVYLDSNGNGMYFFRYIYKGTKYTTGKLYISFPVIILDNIWYVKMNDTIEITNSNNSNLIYEDLESRFSDKSIKENIFTKYQKGPIYSRQVIVEYR
jgi:glutaredoxin